MIEPRKHARGGLALGLAAYLAWGFFPFYFKALSGVPPTEIVAHRILWSVVLLALLLTLWRRWPQLASTLRRPRLVLALVASAFLISCNWLVYIWAVVSGHVLEASLGYYLNPLVNVLLGVALLKERLTRLQAGAVVLAAAGVAVLAVGAGTGAWISLTLAFSFALYGFVRKVTPVEAVEGLSIETALLAPIALGWLLWLHAQGAGSFGGDRWTDFLLVLSGVATAVPLLLFNAAAKRLPYSTLGFLQYVAPSIQFLLAVLAFGEVLTFAHMLCFGAIWAAVAMFAMTGFRSSRTAARARAAAGV